MIMILEFSQPKCGRAGLDRKTGEEQEGVFSQDRETPRDGQMKESIPEST